MDKRVLQALLTLTVVMTSSPVFGANYNFETTYVREQFGQSTDSDKPADYSHIENIRRDKNASYFSPKYGVFSGELPSDQTNPYFDLDHNKSSISAIPDYGNYNNGVYSVDASEQGFMAPTSTLNGGNGANVNTSTINNSQSISNISDSNLSSNNVNLDSSMPKVTISYSEQEYNHQNVYVPITQVQKQSDGSLGTIKIPKLNIDKKVKESVSLDIMKIAIGHFEFTSQWDGNVGIASVRPDRALLKVD